MNSDYLLRTCLRSPWPWQTPLQALSTPCGEWCLSSAAPVLGDRMMWQTSSYGFSENELIPFPKYSTAQRNPQLWYGAGLECWCQGPFSTNLRRQFCAQKETKFTKQASWLHFGILTLILNLDDFYHLLALFFAYAPCLDKHMQFQEPWAMGVCCNTLFWGVPRFGKWKFDYDYDTITSRKGFTGKPNSPPLDLSSSSSSHDMASRLCQQPLFWENMPIVTRTSSSMWVKHLNPSIFAIGHDHTIYNIWLGCKP